MIKKEVPKLRTRSKPWTIESDLALPPVLEKKKSTSATNGILFFLFSVAWSFGHIIPTSHLHLPCYHMITIVTPRLWFSNFYIMKIVCYLTNCWSYHKLSSNTYMIQHRYKLFPLTMQRLLLHIVPSHPVWLLDTWVCLLLITINTATYSTIL